MWDNPNPWVFNVCMFLTLICVHVSHYLHQKRQAAENKVHDELHQEISALVTDTSAMITETSAVIATIDAAFGNDRKEGLLQKIDSMIAMKHEIGQIKRALKDAGVSIDGGKVEVVQKEEDKVGGVEAEKM